MNAQTVYASEKEKHSVQLALLQKKQSRYGWLRLGLILITAIVAYQVFLWAGAWAWLAAFIGIGLFLWVVSADAENNKKIKFLKALVHINETELRMLQGDMAQCYDGAGFLPHEHAYAHDLDLFGPHSLFQFLNRCAGEQGRALLAHDLLHPLLPEEVVQRQEAATELAPMWGWRQAVQAHAAANTLSVATEKRLQNWLQQPGNSLSSPAWRWFVPLYSTFACSVAVAALFDLIPGGVFSLCFMVFILISFAVGKKATAVSTQLSGVVSELATLEQVVQSLEQPLFKSPLLVQLQAGIGAGKNPASAQIKKLKDILNRFDLRLNVFLFIFLNSFLLWDVRNMRALNSWRTANSVAAKDWFSTVGLFEVAISLATLRFNKPSWAQPSFLPQYFSFRVTAIGHPLIKEEQRVSSDFELEGRGHIALITGSNMAGKSTFLRSLGVNTVLAQMGAVVCARSLQLSPVQLLSSMRIADNLAENTSTFYAELKKLKTIIDAVQAQRPVFVLLDEILRGTNSLDRHTGSKALIKQLLREGSVAVLASHDVELAGLEASHPGQLDNYHFDAQVAGQELYFDYKLKNGVCTNLNASVLMKKIGIEL